jgi:16S rRNA processing protein RimM
VRGEERATLLKLVGIETVEQAESLRGATLHVGTDELPPLAPGEYYLSDLVGAEVFVGSEPLGTVVEVRPYPTVDVMVIENAQGRRFEQPILDCWLEHVDVGRGQVRLVSKDGLVE